MQYIPFGYLGNHHLIKLFSENGDKTLNLATVVSKSVNNESHMVDVEEQTNIWIFRESSSNKIIQ